MEAELQQLVDKDRIIDSINNPTQDPPPVQYHPQKSD